MTEQRSHVAVLSDIHIGDNTPNCWYQDTVHRNYLIAALRWIISRRDLIREVVLLGDVFDTWTYVPSQIPPTMSQIIDCNLAVLGPNGALADLVKAFPGAVKLLLGNHDGTFTHRDIDVLNGRLGGNLARGEAITFVDCAVLVLEAAQGGARTAFTHGHHWCMFNSPNPDPQAPWNGLPIGHFVTRAIAHKWRMLQKPHNVAQKKGRGTPGLEIGPAVEELFRNAFYHPFTPITQDLSSLLLRYMAKKADTLSLDEPIHLPGGQMATMNDAIAAYRGLYDHWSKEREVDFRDTPRAGIADFKETWLPWFAQRAALQTDSALVVMGHTHTPVREMTVSPVNYVNSGYMCVSEPDRVAAAATFTLVDIQHARAALYRVVGDPTAPQVLPIAPHFAPSTPVLPPLPGLGRQEDYSSYVRIFSRHSRPLRLKDASESGLYGGRWVVPPPPVIAPGARANVWLMDDSLSPTGTDGTFTYVDEQDGKELDFRVTCPTHFGNRVESPVAFTTRTASPDWGPWHSGKTESHGHPLQAYIVVGPVPPKSTGSPQPPTAAKPKAGTAGPASTKGRPCTRGRDCNRLVKWVPDPRAVPDTPRQLQAGNQASYITIASRLLNECCAPDWRGEVLSHAWLIAADGKAPLMDPATERCRASGVRLRSRPNHIITSDYAGEVFEVTDPIYGTFQYVLIQPHVEAADPAHGGFLFLPRPGSPNLHLVSFNTAKMDHRRRENCNTDRHAERHIINWIYKQSLEFKARVGTLVLQNGSRQPNDTVGRPNPDKPYGPCRRCCGFLKDFLEELNQGRAHAVLAAMSWGRHYKVAPPDSCELTTRAEDLDRMAKSGWKMQARDRRDRVPTGSEWRSSDPDWGPTRTRSTR
jgi:hypothetical protein